MKKNEKLAEETQEKKNDYKKPEIKNFGSIAELTQGTASDRLR